MKYPRLGLFVINAIGLFAFSVAAVARNPVYGTPVVGYGVAFLMLLVVLLPVHLAMRGRWNGATTAVVSFLAFCAFTALADNVAVGVVAAVQLAITLGCIPAPRPVTQKAGWRGVEAFAPERTAMSEADEALADMRRATARLDAATAALQGARSVH